MSSCGRRGSVRRGNRKKPNRYDPNRPDWNAVHGERRFAGILEVPVEFIAAAWASSMRMGKRS